MDEACSRSRPRGRRGAGAAETRRAPLSRLLAVVSVLLLAVGIAVAAPAAAPDRTAPRIAQAVMLDANRNFKADRVRLTYSEPVRHPVDRGGKYPFTVAGYQIRSVGAASGRTVVLLLVEKRLPDHRARPSVRYRRTSTKPVRDRAGNQAAAQLFAAVRAHGHTPPAPAPPPPQPPPPARDSDGDGWDDSLDCAPNDRTIHPGAPDLPDLAFVDSNCDGIDGTAANAIFVSPAGNDANPGTKESPKRQLEPAIVAASFSGRNVYVAAGTYRRFVAETGVGVYGGYDPADWSRRGTGPATVVTGSPEAVFVDDERGIVLQLLSVHGTNAGESAYGIRAVNGSSVRLERVTVTAGAGAAGARGANGLAGSAGSAGAPGRDGACDSNQTVGSRWGGGGGKGGTSTAGRAGGDGGKGGDVTDFGGQRGAAGGTGQVGTDGGAGGASGNPGRPGANGRPATPGNAGSLGAGGRRTAARAAGTWIGASGVGGSPGTFGNGGGGGGGGGSQNGFFVLDGPGNGGGGGGSGGGRGGAGGGGAFGGGSFGVYLHNSAAVITGSSVAPGAGGAGGAGGDGASGGTGGAGGPGARKCTSEVGAGGNGGRGGDGGPGGGGGGGAGGPSIAVMRLGTSSVTLTATTLGSGTAGPGGAAGARGVGAPAASEPGIAAVIYPPDD